MFPPLLQSYVARAWIYLRVNSHRDILHFNAILEPSITQANLIDLRDGLTLSSPLMGED